MKWKNVCLIVLDNSAQSICPTRIMAIRRNLQIPNNLVFGIPGTPFLPLTHNCMRSVVDGSSKLFIIAHGNSKASYVGDDICNPEQIAARIRYWGADRAGLITFTTCLLGRDNYLEQLRHYLPEVGYFSAPTGFCRLETHEGGEGDEFARLISPSFNAPVQSYTFKWWGHHQKANDRLKIVQGFGIAIRSVASARYPQAIVHS